MQTALIHLADATSQILGGAGQTCSRGACADRYVSGIFGSIATAITFVVGAVAVIMIIVGAFQYVTSNGDAKKVSAAKDTIFYSLVGVVVSIVAFAAVKFVIQAIG